MNNRASSGQPSTHRQQQAPPAQPTQFAHDALPAPEQGQAPPEHESQDSESTAGELGSEMGQAPRLAARGFDAQEAWRMTLASLALQMSPTQFDTWMRDTYVLAYEDGEFIIGTPNSFAHGWLDKQVRPKIKRALGRIAGRTVQVTFRTAPRAVATAVDVSDMPLYRSASVPVAVEPSALVNGVDLDAGRNGTDSHFDDATSAAASSHKPADSGTTHGSDVHDAAVYRNGALEDARPDARLYSSDDNSSDDTPRGGPSADEAERSTRASRPSLPPATPARKAAAMENSRINPLFVFETFVVGKYNQLAHAAAQAVANQPGREFNPLFIHGGVGLGKTHLLHAIANRARQHGWAARYCTSEQFTNDLISAIRTQDTEAFRNRYREVDVLLLDDIQFIGGNETTQEEFFHTFNHLHSLGRQIVISSDRPPKSLATLEERLRSRFAGGLQADISKPDYETRVAILQSKARRTDVYIHEDVLRLIAERVDSNVRELEGALKSLVMQARLRENNALNLPLAEHMLDNLAPQRLPCAPALVIQIVAEHYRLSPDDLVGKRRPKNIAHARQVAMYLLRVENGLSLPVIGTHLGGRDHSTVRYGVGRVEESLEMDDALRRDIMQLREKIYAPFRD